MGVSALSLPPDAVGVFVPLQDPNTDGLGPAHSVPSQAPSFLSVPLQPSFYENSPFQRSPILTVSRRKRVWQHPGELIRWSSGTFEEEEKS